MKIDKTNPRHWLCLIAFGINVVIAMALRPLVRRRRRGGRRRVVMYGHKLSGNLLALHRYWRAHARDDFDVVFLTMDKAYHLQLLLDGVPAVLATRPPTIALLMRADAVISDHGLHSLTMMVGRSSLKFFDVWHGVGFKGLYPEDFKTQHQFDEIWVASPLMAAFWIKDFGFAPNNVKVTGYARMDRLVHPDPHAGERIRQELGLGNPDTGKLVLFAPTWKNDAEGRSIFPFGETPDSFLRALSDVAQRTGSTVVIRAHLNTPFMRHARYPRIVWIPFEDYPDTEGVLLASDVLVCDWSSIAFDWILLNRPTLFLDVEAPYAKGFSLTSRHRYGALAKDLDSLVSNLERYLCNPDAYRQAYGSQVKAIRDEVLGEFADGCATKRCVARLKAHVDGRQTAI